MKWQDYALGVCFLFTLILTDQLSQKSWKSGDGFRTPASIEAKMKLESEDPFFMHREHLKKIQLESLLNSKWNRVKRVGVLPSQESNNLLDSHLKFVSHINAHRILEYFQYPADQQRRSGRKGIVRFLEFNIHDNIISFEFPEEGVSNTCVINKDNIMRCRYQRIHDDGTTAMDIYNYYELEV